MARRVAGTKDPARTRPPHRHLRRWRQKALARSGHRPTHYRHHRPDVVPAAPTQPVSGNGGAMVNEIRQRGIALLIVLWGLVLLAVIAASFASGSRTETMLARNLVDNAKARALADAGVYRAISALLETKFDRRWRVDGTVYPFAYGDGTVRISVQDEGGKIDLNKGRDEHLRGLLQLAGLDFDEAAALVDAIADFRDEDDMHRLNGAEDSDYRAAGLPYGAKNRPFEAVEELQQVLGMTRATYERVAPFLTVFSGRSRIDLTNAPREVLLAVPGIVTGEVESLLTERAQMTGPIPTKALPIPAADRGTFGISKGRVFSVRSEARTPGGATFARQAVVRLTRKRDRPFEFLAWKRGRKTPAGIEGKD